MARVLRCTPGRVSIGQRAMLVKAPTYHYRIARRKRALFLPTLSKVAGSTITVQWMNKVMRSGRTVASVHREVLGLMLAVQILLAQGMTARLVLPTKQVASSARQLVLLVCREMNDAVRGRTRRGFLQRAAGCHR